MNIFSNREIYIHQKIDEYLLLYDANKEECIGFIIDGFGNLYFYIDQVDFDKIKKGLLYKASKEYYDCYPKNYIFVHIYVKENEYYQLNMYPENVDLNTNLSSYYLFSGILNIDTDIAITLKHKEGVNY